MSEKEFIDLRANTPGKVPSKATEKPQLKQPLTPIEEPEHPKQIGPYRLIRVIAEGGMGTVYLAEQDKPIKRQVALKVVKVGMDTKEVLARFDAERQALALMDHPNIAKVLDGGAAENGRPYFVMELVKGVPITQYCDEANLPTKTRLALFQRVCQAVQHAHQKGIIHRDIKPSNVMVTVQDGEPVPKVIDFGIAKATNQRLTEMTLFTQFNQFIGTPEYMAPEQADLSCLDVDTRADVYSLGVLLYELLTGSKPFDMKTLLEKGYEEILRHIREVTPPRPSNRVGDLGDRFARAADSRKSTPRLLGKTFQGDLDWIVMKALEKERTRRYETADAFAEDIANYLADRTVFASPPSAAYRFNKFARRHRALLVASGFVAVAMLGAVGALAWSFVNVRAERDAANIAKLRETEARQRAEEARGESEAVTDFLSDMLASVSPNKVGIDVTVREVLDETATEVGPKFEDRPLIEARLRHTLGSAYYGLGLYDQAEPHSKRALVIRTRELGEGHEDTLRTANRLGSLYRLQGRYNESEEMLAAAYEESLNLRGDEHWQTLNLMSNLGSLRYNQGRYEEAETLFLRNLEINQRLKGEEDDKTVNAVACLALLYDAMGRYDEAETLALRNLELYKKIEGPESPETLHAMNNLAILYDAMGRDSEVQKLLEETLAIRKRVLGEEHPNTLVSLSNLGNHYKAKGRFVEAEEMYQQALEIRTRTLGPKHPDTFLSMRHLASLYSSQGHYEKAEPLMRESIRLQKELLGDEHPETLSASGSLGILLWQAGNYPEAAAVHEQLVASDTRVMGAEHPETLQDANFLGIIYWSQARYDDAVRIFSETNRIQRRVLGEENPSTLNSAMNLGMVFVDQGKIDKAEAIYLENLATRKRVQGEKHPQVLDAMNNLANLYYSSSRLAEAEAMHREVWEIRKGLLGPEHPKTLGSGGNLASVYLDWGRLAEAEALYLELLEAKKRVMGEKHPDTLNEMANLAIVYKRQGRYQEAADLQTRALTGRERAFGKNHPETLNSMFELAEISDKQGDPEEAESLYRRVWQGRITALGEDHSMTLRSIEYLAAFLVNNDRLDEGLPLIKDLIRQRKRIADESGATPGDLHDCGLLLLSCLPKELREPDTALVLYTRANQLTNYESPEFLHNLALAYHKTGKRDRAVAFQEKALALLSKDNPNRIEYEDRLAEFLAAKN